MKVFRNISLFMIAATFIYAAGAYTGNWFYPNRIPQRYHEQQDRAEDMTAEADNSTVSKADNVKNAVKSTQKAAFPHSESNTSVSVSGQKKELTADTEYIIEEYDMKTDAITEVTEKIPAQYIGMDRDAFIEAMSDYELSPAITDLEKGFLSLEVISFSPEKVIVRKSYQTAVQSNQFCLVAEQNYVVVYYGDLNTLFMYTDIKLDSLPKELQEEIIRVKYITGEGDLYNFLESYSS